MYEFSSEDMSGIDRRCDENITFISEMCRAKPLWAFIETLGKIRVIMKTSETRKDFIFFF